MKKLSLIVACLLMSNISALAIGDAGLNGSNAGVINKQNTMQLKDLQIEKQYIETVPKALDNKQKQEDDSKEKRDVLKGDLTYNPQFKLNKIVFQGNDVYSDKKLMKLANDMIGKDVYLENIMDLTVAISRFYQKNGYLTSYASLEPQEINDGTVVIKITESKVSQKEVVGNRWEKEWYLKNLALGGSGLSNGKVFNSKYLQGAMKNLNKEPYLKSSVEISKNPKDENTIIKLNIADRFPISFDAAWDDYGRNYTGRQRATTVLGIDNLTGMGDKIYGGAILANGANGALAGYQIPISPYGTKLSFDYSYSKVNLGGPYRAQNIVGNSTNYSIRLVQPLRNTADTEINASMSLDALNSKTDVLSLGQNISDYSLRVLRTGVYGMFDDKYGRFISSMGVDLGTTAFGASSNIQNGPQSSFYKLVSSMARIQRLPKKSLGIARLNSQYSPRPLYAAEQMYLGGVYSIRGYQPSEIIGDYGFNGSLEIRTPLPFLAKMLPKKISSWSDKVKVAAFYDFGYVKEHNDLYGYPNNFLQSVGVGAYINLTDAIYAQVGVGIPVGAKYYKEDNARFYFSVNTEADRIFMKPREKL